MPETPDSREPQRRVFFALWPSDPLQQAMHQAARAVARGKGRVMRRHNLHLTLAFIGNVSAERLDCMRMAAVGVVAAPFELQLDRFGYWRRPRIAWLGAEQTPEALSELVGSLNTALGDCGYQPESRPFQAHVTLVRKAQGCEPPADFAPLAWPVTDFCLVESVGGPDGVNYEVIGRWPLTGWPNSRQLDKHPV